MTPPVRRSADPQYRRDRAKRAAEARTTPEHHARRIAAEAPRLTPEQTAIVVPLLREALQALDAQSAGRAA